MFLLYGDNSDSENFEIRKNLKKVPNEKSIILIATGQKIGEGFDFPRLDTLMFGITGFHLVEDWSSMLGDYIEIMKVRSM